MKNEIIALVLAGGQGSRLEILTENIAKPALPFGGEYRIVDFTLSNCLNSGINTIGLLVQYKPFSLIKHLNEYRQSVQQGCNKWDLTILPPYTDQNGNNWYMGTANAVYKNLEYIEHYNPQYVMILSGDHIYKMNYNTMLNYHKKKNADVTMGVVPVQLEEASRFGIITTDKNNQVKEFQEKPIKPKSRLASMGIYIFNWHILKRYLSDEENGADFGHHIIPSTIKDNLKLYAYRFNSYWKDIGIINSYYESHMDLIKGKVIELILNKKWPIYSAKLNINPYFVSGDAVVKGSLISSGSIIYGKVENSIISRNVYIGKGSIVRNSVILPDVKIAENSIVEKAIISSDSFIGNNCKIGLSRSSINDGQLSIIGDKCLLEDGVIISSGCNYSNSDYFKDEEVIYA